MKAPVPPAGLVWDWPVRACHWLLAISFAGAWATHYAGAAWFEWHRRLGYATLVLVVFRIAWGFVGPRYARFSSFVVGPAAIAAYVRRDFSAGAPRHDPPGVAALHGHNPLGALAVLAMLALLLVQASTGLFANDDVSSTGPFVGWVSEALSHRLTRWHRLNADALLALVALHVTAIGYYERWRGRRLIRAMITGRQPGATGIAGSRGWLAIVISLLLAAALALALRAAPEVTGWE